MKGAIMDKDLMKPPEHHNGDNFLSLEDLNSKVSTNGWAVIFFLGYLILGLLYYCYSDQQLNALDAVYLSVITFTTVGYGDIPTGNRYFATFYVLLGAGLVGSFFGIFSNDIMEAQEAAMQERLLGVAKSMDQLISNSAKQAEEYRKSKLREYFQDVTDKKDTELTQLGKFKRGISTLFVEQEQMGTVDKLNSATLQAYEEELSEIRSKGIVDFFFLLVSIFSGAVCMMLIEDWRFEEGLYWAVVTVTTVGYGDVTPDTDGGKIFTIFYTMIACALAAKGFRDVVCYPLILRAKDNELLIARQFGDHLSEHTLRKLLSNEFFDRVPRLKHNPKEVQKAEFVLLILQMMNRVQEKDLLLASSIFDQLDVEGDGVLSEEAQRIQIEKARKRDTHLRKEQLDAQSRHHSNGTGTSVGGISGMFTSAFGSSGRERRSSSQGTFDEEDGEHHQHQHHTSTMNPMMMDDHDDGTSSTSTLRQHMHPNDQSSMLDSSITSSPPASNRLFAPTPNPTPVSSGRAVHWGTNISYTSLQQHNPLHGEEPATIEVDLS